MIRVLSILLIIGSITAKPLLAATAEYNIQLKDHLFYPSKINIPAGRKVKLIIHNQDSTPEEFDSFSLNREKVLFPKQKSFIYIGPLEPGEYDFFGEYNPNTAQGKVIVVEQQGKPNVN